MPFATREQYLKMIESAQNADYAYPAINVTSTSTANAAMKAFADNKSDGIIQVSTGGGQFASGQQLNDMVLGTISLAQHVQLVAAKYDVCIALHTDHCQPKKVDSFLVPLIEESERRVKAGQTPLFNSHMFDGSELPLQENLAIAVKLHERLNACGMLLEVETGVVGGEEDGVNNEDTPADKLYTTPDEMVEVAKTLGKIGPFLYAATFGNVHGVYKPGNVKLRPDILKQGQDAVVAALGKDAYHNLVFHGGSGSELADIHETLNYGVIKMNVDTDTQYAYTRPVIDYMLKNYDKVLKVEGEVGVKKFYDPRAWMKKAENAMTDRVSQAIKDLRSDGKSIMFQ